MIIKAGDCVAIVWKENGVAKLHDGVLVSPKTVDTNKPLPKVTILHMNIHGATTACIYTELITKQIVNIGRTTKIPHNGFKCPSPPKQPSIKAGECVAVKFKGNTPNKSGFDVKNGRLVCPITNGTTAVTINHWTIKKGTENKPKPEIVESTKTYKNIVQVVRVFTNTKIICGTVKG